jgi:hypothetical protein
LFGQLVQKTGKAFIGGPTEAVPPLVVLEYDLD